MDAWMVGRESGFKDCLQQSISRKKLAGWMGGWVETGKAGLRIAYSN